MRSEASYQTLLAPSPWVSQHIFFTQFHLLSNLGLNRLRVGVVNLVSEECHCVSPENIPQSPCKFAEVPQGPVVHSLENAISFRTQ